MLEKPGEDFLHPCVEAFLVCRARVPRRNRIGPRRQLGVLRDDAELLLVLDGELALPVPPVIELPLVFVGPFLVHVMRSMSRTRRKVDEERLVRRGGLLLSDPTDRSLGERLGEVPLRVVVWHLDGRGVLEERRVPLVRLAALESVEVVEPLARRPPIVGTTDAKLVVGRVVPLAKRSGGVLIAFEYLRDARRFLWPLRVVAGKTRRHLGDASGVHRVVI